MAVLFFFMVTASLIWLTMMAPGSILSIMLQASAGGVELALMLAGIYIVWMGIVQVAIDSGVIDALGRLMSPIIRLLFGRQSKEVSSLLATNISANMIGAGAAATPAAIEAISKMAKEEEERTGKAPINATMPMIMLFVISATSMQIIPTTVIGILESHGAQNTSSIILPTFIVSTVTTIMGILLVWILCKRSSKKECSPLLDSLLEIGSSSKQGLSHSPEGS